MMAVVKASVRVKTKSSSAIGFCLVSYAVTKLQSFVVRGYCDDKINAGEKALGLAAIRVHEYA